MANTFIEKLFDMSALTKGIQGPLGKFYGRAGKSFGSEGTDYGFLGASQMPKIENYFQLSDHFTITDYFDMKNYFDTEEIADHLLSHAFRKVLGGE